MCVNGAHLILENIAPIAINALYLMINIQANIISAPSVYSYGHNRARSRLITVEAFYFIFTLILRLNVILL